MLKSDFVPYPTNPSDGVGGDTLRSILVAQFVVYPSTVEHSIGSVVFNNGHSLTHKALKAISGLAD